MGHNRSDRDFRVSHPPSLSEFRREERVDRRDHDRDRTDRNRNDRDRGDRRDRDRDARRRDERRDTAKKPLRIKKVVIIQCVPMNYRLISLLSGKGDG